MNMAVKKATRIEYMCRYCGAKTGRPISIGRPDPGQCLRRSKTKEGHCQPHSWVINKRY